MLRRRSILSLLLGGAALLGDAVSLGAQAASDAARCVTGALGFARSDPELLHDWADSLAWPSPRLYPLKYGSTAADGLRALALAADSLGAQLQRLAPSDSANIAAVLGALADAERALGSDASALSAATARLTPIASLTASDSVRIAGRGLSLAEPARVTSTGLCIIADAASRYLKEQQLAAAQEHERIISRAAANWDLYSQQAPSMTLLERWGASCRLWKLSLILVGDRCAAALRRAGLEWAIAAPSWRSMLLHPRPSLRPIFSADSAYTAGALLEVYGVVRHSYGKKRLWTWGASWAITRPPVGREQYAGAVFYLGAGTASVFWNEGRPLWMVSPDVLGWFTSTRAAMRQLGSVVQP
ncbi:hypothetical protein Strain138_001760 [Pseudogemmatithrix spongiicola]|uniref:Uncharacterized protein n=1 Tax=Pseudogemmatithrix spongiicola TaxID=3062599 RepID=A0AA49JV85_9BACT|nr:hypothetical protein Strain138_001760 [Gemmatimonadaceae bacterium 'strain 138']WKW15374.1 hypothetical protein Strain318_001759 [Gemmatimonadaceae bacterium 'strain 318']